MSGDGGMMRVITDPVFTAVQKLKLVREERLHIALAAGNASGRGLLGVLVGDGDITQTDAAEIAALCKLDTNFQKLRDLPPWDVVVGVVPGQATSGAIAIYDSKDARSRAFLLATADATSQRVRSLSVDVTANHSRQIAGKFVVDASMIALVESAAADQLGGADDREDTKLQAQFDDIGRDALARGASDIHLSVLDGRGQVFYRVHGELEHQQDLPAEHLTQLCRTVYNTMVEDGSTKGGFDVADKQDAVIERRLAAGRVRFRYSGLPLAPYPSFDVTLRIIPIGVETKRLSLEQLGYSADQCDELERIFSHASGLILFAGTTGSGKSTSMANMLWKMAEDRPGKKIRTIEEPVESRIPGTYQSPVVRKSNDGSDFTSMLRQLMRADPDIIMVGEIRDASTAELSIQAVRSGHLCVSTIHADGAPICYDRLSGMGVERADLASVGLVQGLIYQKLLQVLCDGCKIPFADYEREHAGAPIIRRVRSAYRDQVDGIYFRNDSGCAHCNNRGIKGRTVAAEILRPATSMLKAIADNDSPALWRAWRAQIDSEAPHVMRGRTAFEHAKAKVAAGRVCPLGLESEFKFIDEQVFEGDDH